MTKLTTAALALLLVGLLAACSKDTGASGTPASPAASSSSSSSSSAAPTTPATSATSATSGSTPTAGGSATSAAPVTVDQSTPEAAMTSWLGAMVAGQGQTVCDVMAIKGQPIKEIEGAAKACGEKITPMLDKITALGGAFTGLQISGATVSGDTATFESVTTTPALAADVVSTFQAVKVGGLWYVSQG
ncbi:MAG: hypothetical protein JWP82_790 [Humibacillus sp.]|nr:hypothetical protein [Humibacillus sp.]